MSGFGTGLGLEGQLACSRPSREGPVHGVPTEASVFLGVKALGELTPFLDLPVVSVFQGWKDFQAH